MKKLYKKKYTLSNKTLISRASQKKLFEKNGLNFHDFETFKDNPNKILDSMKDTKNKPLKNGYKAQIATTLRDEHPNLDINIKKYKIKSKKETRIEDPEFVTKVKTLAEDCSKRIELVNSVGLIDLGEYETCLVALISLLTTMRTSEILQLKYENLKEILDQKMASIIIKGGNESRFIPLNEILTNLIHIIFKNKNNVKSFLENSNNKMNETRCDRFKIDYIITSSESYLKKKIKELAALSSLFIPILGFKPFRKLTSTILINNGGLNIASALNNHSDISTTQEYYNIASNNVVGDVYSYLDKIINGDALQKTNDLEKSLNFKAFMDSKKLNETNENFNQNEINNDNLIDLVENGKSLMHVEPISMDIDEIPSTSYGPVNTNMTQKKFDQFKNSSLYDTPAHEYTEEPIIKQNIKF